MKSCTRCLMNPTYGPRAMYCAGCSKALDRMSSRICKRSEAARARNREYSRLHPRAYQHQTRTCATLLCGRTWLVTKRMGNSRKFCDECSILSRQASWTRYANKRRKMDAAARRGNGIRANGMAGTAAASKASASA